MEDIGNSLKKLTSEGGHLRCWMSCGSGHTDCQHMALALLVHISLPSTVSCWMVLREVFNVGWHLDGVVWLYVIWGMNEQSFLPGPV